jgi:hypothetical protein
VQRDLTTLTEALLSLHERLEHAESDDGYSAQQRRWAKQNILLATRNLHEAIAWLNNY